MSNKVYKLPQKIDVNSLKELIEFLDSCLANYFGDLEQHKKKIESGEFGVEVRRDWESVEKSIIKMIAVIRRLPTVKICIKLATLTHLLSVVFLTSAIVTVGLIIYGVYDISSLISILILSATIGVVSEISSIRFRRRIKIEIDKYIKSHTGKFKFLKEKIRIFTQNLINTYAKYIKEQKLDPNEYTLSLYNIDYAGIKVLKKPGILKKKYTIKVT